MDAINARWTPNALPKTAQKMGKDGRGKDQERPAR